jgi:hypothetical protein
MTCCGESRYPVCARCARVDIGSVVAAVVCFPEAGGIVANFLSILSRKAP